MGEREREGDTKQKPKTHFFLSFSLAFQTINFFCSICMEAHVVVSGDDGDDNDDDYECLVCSDCGIYGCWQLCIEVYCSVFTLSAF